MPQNGSYMAQTHEFGRNPDHLPENRKNQRKWKEFAFDYTCTTFKCSVKSS